MDTETVYKCNSCNGDKFNYQIVQKQDTSINRSKALGGLLFIPIWFMGDSRPKVDHTIRICEYCGDTKDLTAVKMQKELDYKNRHIHTVKTIFKKVAIFFICIWLFYAAIVLISFAFCGI